MQFWGKGPQIAISAQKWPKEWVAEADVLDPENCSSEVHTLKENKVKD